MSGFNLEWIDKVAKEGPLFRIGEQDVYCRQPAGSRVIRLRAVHSPDPDYVAPATEAFQSVAAAWGHPVLFVIDPVSRALPNAGFLLDWSQAAFRNGSVERVFMVINIPLPKMVRTFLCDKFSQGGMPFEIVRDEAALQERLQQCGLGLG